MSILDINKALEVGRISYGTVLINTDPQIRKGKRNEYMVGDFMTPDGTVQFKIWEERTFALVRDVGIGIYDVEVEGSDFNGPYLTVRRITETQEAWKPHDFLPAVPREELRQFWRSLRNKLGLFGVSEKAWQILELILADSEIDGRFVIEGAAIYYHDNKIGGLMNHTGKMLNILVAILENLPALQESADLLFLGISLHDIGKVFEYRDLGLGEYWYANHRVRGIELLAKYKEAIFNAYDERFYRQIQSIISGHHGDFGDRPTSVAAAIVHYIDSLESQVTGLIESQEGNNGRFRYADWGWLEAIDLSKKETSGSGDNENLL